MANEQSKHLTIPLTPEELTRLETRAKAAGIALATYCRDLLALESSAVDSVATFGPDDLASTLVTVLGDESVKQDAVVDRLKQAPKTDAAELDKALVIVREAIAAERAFALDARVAISALERDEE